TKGLEVLKTLPDTPERAQHELSLQLALGSPLSMLKGQIAPEVEYAYARAYALCQELGDSPQRFSVMAGLWRLHLSRAHLQMAPGVAKPGFTPPRRLH